MFENVDVLRTVLLNVHVISVVSWVGAMYFNLTLLFPMYKSRGEVQYAELMMEQGSRAWALLYLLAFLTLISGLGLYVESGDHQFGTWEAVKILLWGVMLSAHLYGSLVLWPKVFLALNDEIKKLFFSYKLSMLVSASAGSVALSFSLVIFNSRV